VKELKGDSNLQDADYVRRRPDDEESSSEEADDDLIHMQAPPETILHNDLNLTEDDSEEEPRRPREDRDSERRSISPIVRQATKTSILNNLNTGTRSNVAPSKDHSNESLDLPNTHHIAQKEPEVHRPTSSSRIPALRQSMVPQPRTSRSPIPSSTSTRPPAPPEPARDRESFGLPLLDQGVMDGFVKSHRQQIREITECCKSETKMLTTFAIGLGDESSDRSEATAAFVEYVVELDQVLEKKFRVMVDLRQKIKSIMRPVVGKL